jgi:hypothetical protein
MKRKRWPAVLLLGVGLISCLTGCEQSYPGYKLKESIQDICRKEYGIEQIEVQTAGETVGVYMPMNKLFNFDFKDILEKGKVPNLEKLFEPSPEAFDKIENVLFSISRVLLSTDRKIRFYILQATDIEKTGQQLTIKGNVDDIRRVRIWDISRGEYRRRVVSEWSYNKASVWHRPVRKFFKDLEILPVDEIRKKYFETEVSDAAIQNLFLGKLIPSGEKKPQTLWQFSDLKSIPVSKNEVVVYAKVRPVSIDLAKSSGAANRGAHKEESPELKYMLLVSMRDRKPRLMRVVPFQYLDSTGIIQDVAVPSELRFDDQSIKWEREFQIQDIQYGPFLAEQLTRRVQNLLMEDERVRNTFEDLKLQFDYQKEPAPACFSMTVDAVLKNEQAAAGRNDSLLYHEDMIYALNIAFREFVMVLRSYGFNDYQALQLHFVQEPNPWLFDREGLELFRQKKIDFQGLLALQ